MAKNSHNSAPDARTFFQPYLPLFERPKLTMKAWRITEAVRCGVGQIAIAMRLKRGKYPNLAVERVNRRVVYVVPRPKHAAVAELK